MNRILWSRILICVVAACAVFASPRRAGAQDEDTSNAAMWYERAQQKQGKITSEDMNVILRYRQQGGPPSAEVRQVMSRVAPMLSDIRRGTNLGFADFASRLGSNGFRLEQTGTLYNFTPFLDADIKMKLADGDTVGAASQIAAVYRMMSHAGDGHTISSSGTASGLNHFTEAALDAAMEDNALGPAEMGIVLDAMHSLDPKDPFQFVSALAWQQAEAQRLLQQAQQPGSQMSAVDVMRAIGTPINYFGGLKELSEEQRFDAIRDCDDLFGQFIKIEASDDPQWVAQELDRLKVELENGTLVPLVGEVLRSLLQYHEAIAHGRQVLQDRQAQLARLIEGKIDPDQLANAAIYYRRAIAHLDSLDPAWSAAIEALLKTSEALPPETLAALDQANRQAADAAIAEFTRGSLIRRCDFSTRRVEDELFIPTYSDGMRRGFALLCVEALRLDAAGQPNDALAQLATCFRMIGHFGGDGLILSAIESQDGFALARLVAQHLIADVKAPAAGDGPARIELARLAELAAAIRRTGPHDPFGFDAAVKDIAGKARQNLQYMIVRDNVGFDPLDSATPEQLAAIDRAAKWLDALDPGQRWYAYGLVILNNTWDSGLNGRLRSRTAPYTRPVMASILDLAEVDAQALQQRCTSESLMRFSIPPIDELLNLSQRMERAAADQREGMLLAEALTELARSSQRDSTRFAMDSQVRSAPATAGSSGG